MSGLVVHFSRGGPADRDAVRRGLAAAPHRGSVTRLAGTGDCLIGIALHEDGDHGDLAVKDDLVVAVAGVIDNLGELAAEWADHLVLPADGGPAALVLALFRELGADVARILRGAYAIAVTDGRTLLCLRDHLGSRPLFYRDEGTALWVASEAKQVIAAAGITREPDLDALTLMFYGHREDDLPVALKGVRRLPKASLLRADASGTSTRRYWDPSPLVETLRISSDEVRPRFDALMARAVDRVLRGDDILALSGGLDSPTIAIFGAEAYHRRFGRPLPVLSMVFPDYPSADESAYITEIVAMLGLELHAYQPPITAQALAKLDRWTELTDGPWMGLWEPAADEDRYERLHTLGRRNYLTGDFAEYDMAIPFHLVTHLIWKRKLRALIRQIASQRQQGARVSKIGRQVASAFLPARFFMWYRAVRPVWPVPEWIDPKRMVPTNPVERLSPWERWRHHQLAGFLGVGLPFEAYHIFNEASRVAVRWPWADVDLWEFFVSLPAEVKFPGAQSKQLLRGLIRDRLPASVVNRRDRTVLDEFVQRRFDYASLGGWIGSGDFRMPGVDYAVLRRRLDRGNLGNLEYASIKDLAQVHAFLSNWVGATSRETAMPAAASGSLATSA
jgi:asparagine synthase (glutamine-hydrolysing)